MLASVSMTFSPWSKIQDFRVFVFYLENLNFFKIKQNQMLKSKMKHAFIAALIFVMIHSMHVEADLVLID